MAVVSVKTYDTIRLPGSARDTRVLVAAPGQDPVNTRKRLQLINQQGVTDSSYTRPTNIFNGWTFTAQYQ